MRKNKAFTLLFASLIVSLLLSISLAISTITLDQFLLSSAGRESQFAFYNADTGIECARYYDRNKGSYDSTNFPNGFYATSPLSSQGTAQVANPITCNNFTVQGSISTDSNNNTVTTYDINTSCTDPTKPSFIIQVTRTYNVSLAHYFTTIQSRGYNTCDTSNPGRVERGLQYSY